MLGSGSSVLVAPSTLPIRHQLVAVKRRLLGNQCERASRQRTRDHLAAEPDRSRLPRKWVHLERHWKRRLSAYDRAMSIESQADLNGLARAGRVVALALAAMRRSVRPGMSTKDLDDVGAHVFRQHGARSAPQLAYGFPGVNCISLNDEAVHGVPSPRRFIARGDLVKIDVTAELHGYMADAAVTVEAGSWTPAKQRLIRTAASALGRGLRAARAGATPEDVGEAIGSAVALRGYRVVPELGGHGIGRTIHEAPSIPNYPDSQATAALTEGLVVTVEPIITTGVGHVRQSLDGWTLPTTDGRLSAHVEHTIVVTRGRPLVLTRLPATA